MNYCYRINPDVIQERTMLHWLEISRKVYNYSLREIKDWVNSRKCSLDYCSLSKEYIIPANKPFPTYYNQQNSLPKAKKEFPELRETPSQVLQTTIRRLHDGWNYFQRRGYGFPRFKKFGQMKSMLFPQFKTNPVTGWQITLPKLGKIPINLHRPIPEGFVVKQARVLRKGDMWEVLLTIESEVSIPEAQPHGEAIGIDLGLEKFLTTSDKEFIALTAQLNLLKLIQRSESLVIRSGSSTTGLNGKPFIPWSKTSGITFLIIFNDPFTSAFNNLFFLVLYNPLVTLFPLNFVFLSPYFGKSSPSKQLD